MSKAQVKLEAGKSGLGIEIEIEIEIVFETDSVQFCASIRLDTDFDFDFDIKWTSPNLGFVHNRFFSPSRTSRIIALI
jgi:hypothetical protein